ncbi:MAG: ECF transporter S component [Vulcanimicrobiota bacterium]
MSYTNKLCYGAILLVMAVVLPQGFHMVGLGPAFLPMHIPVYIAGLILGPFWGFWTGLLAPLLSFLLTGMPPLVPPVLIVMVVELPVIGLLSGYLIKKLNVFWTVFLAIIGGRLVFTAGVILLADHMVSAGQTTWAFAVATFVTTLPGLILQIILIPVVYNLLNSHLCNLCHNENKETGT